MYSKRMNKLENWFCPTKEIFKIFSSNCISKGNKRKHRIFFDRNSKILLVAHADTVHKPKIFKTKNNIIWAAGLDDRLGCWIAYTLSNTLKTDLLITDNEESARTTASFHQCKKYNWIAEFDRGGDDVVLYDCGSEKFEKVLLEFFTVGWGTFSDISMLKTKSACVNVGIGYQHDHSVNSYADLNVTKLQVDKFTKFFYKYKDTPFIRDDHYYGGYNAYFGDDYYSRCYNTKSYKGECEVCRETSYTLKKVIAYGQKWKMCYSCRKVFENEITQILEIADYRTKAVECDYCFLWNYAPTDDNNCQFCGTPLPQEDLV